MTRTTQAMSDHRTDGRLRQGFPAETGQVVAQFAGVLLAVIVSHLIARRLGVGADADAFLLARRLVTSVGEMLNQILVVIFIPLAAARAAAGVGQRAAMALSGGGAFVAGVLLAAVFALAAPMIVGAMAPDFDVETAALATTLIALFAAALPTAVASIAVGAYCNVRGVFALPAFLRHFPRLALAASLALGGGALAVQSASAYALAHVVVLASIAALALSLPHNVAERGPPRAAAAALRGRSLAALSLTLGMLLSLWMETAFATRVGVGAVSILDFGQRLGALCGNTLGAALALVTFANISRRAAEGDHAGMAQSFDRSMRVAIVLLGPLQFGLFVNADAIAELIVGYGATSSAAIAKVAEIIRWIAFAPIGAVVFRMLLMRVLAEPGSRVLRVVASAVAIDVLTRLMIFVVLTPMIGLVAIPLALTTAPLVAALPLGLWLRRSRCSTGRASGPWRLVLATVIATSLAIWLGAQLGSHVIASVAPVGEGSAKAVRIAQVAMSAMLGATVFGAALGTCGSRLWSAADDRPCPG